MCKSLPHRLRRFRADDRGTVALLFALSIIPLFLIVGLAIDGARAYYTNSKMLAVLDSAALATAKSMYDRDLSDDELRNIAQLYVNRHMDPDRIRSITTSNLRVTVDRGRSTLRLDLDAKVANHFAGIVNMPIFNVTQSATAVFGVKEVELGLMLDVSGSMGDFGKINDLKSAVRTLINIMLPDDRGGTARARVGIAPFSSAVNAGSFASRVKGTGGPINCASERTGAAAFLDDEPTAGKYLGASAARCPGKEIVPLTDDKRQLLRDIDDLEPGGSTAGHLGAAWAWYLVSPEWNSIWPGPSRPKPYGDRRTIKSVVLMTDGMFNTQYELGSNGGSALQAERLCENMKTKGIVVYTIGFQVPPEVVPVLMGCASGPSNFFDARDGASLSAAFVKIASELTELRLSP